MLALGLVLAAGATAAQETREPVEAGRSFSAQAAVVTVDAVVLDDSGRPVVGLGPEDFEVFEDGERQAIVGFEFRDHTRPRDEVAPLQVGLTNVGPAGEPGRVMALLVDDLGMTPPILAQVRAALARWIREQALDRDEITVLTTSGDRWWSDRAGRGREDLVATLESVSAKRVDDSATAGWISSWEAYEIGFQGFNLENQVAPADRSRPSPASGGSGPADAAPPGGLNSTLERVARRYLEAGLCSEYAMRACYAQVQGRALEVLERWRQRAEAAFRAVARLSRSLAGVAGRKSILLISEEFIDDRSIDRPFRDAVDAVQRANTAVYFLPARGISGSAVYSAASRFSPGAGDVATIGREERFATLGAENLAETTGGAAVRSNDLARGLERMARESSAYYMLGYQPAGAPDGRWRDLEVKVRREGVTVRARRSYRASRPEDLAVAAREALGADRAAWGAGEHGGDRSPKRPLAPELLAGSVRPGLPLRLATYVGEPGADTARVRVVIEIDNARVHVNRTRTPWRALLDLTVMATRVGEAPLVPVDERLDLSLGPRDVGTGWWMVSREARLPAGEWQIRAWVRDLGSGDSGLLSERVSVPSVDHPYLSSLMLSDRTLPPEQAGEPPRLVPSAQRSFGSRGDVICQYEVFGFGGVGLAGVPKLTGGYTLQRAGDARVRVVEPTPIGDAGERAVRRIVLPLSELEDGRYTITVSVTDALAERRLSASETFVVERPGAEGTGDR